MSLRACMVSGGLLGTLMMAGAAMPSFAQELADPGWDDPFFSSYLERERSRPLDASPPNDGVSFSLPVLGFATQGAPGAGDAAPPIGGPLSARLKSAIPEWPACATASPKVTTVPETPEQAAGAAPGTWFTSTYDFGCLQIVIDGDRNEPDEAFANAAEEAPESGSIELAYQNENAGESIDAEGNVASPGVPPKIEQNEVVISYARGNLVYGVTVSCQTGSESLCASRPALEALTGQLIPVAGRPAPN
ncbi:hypothetical protein [Mesorhizobium sp.]|uniref:hypothetical protein n=1 Tax=Mesorhizobium sp. TaxID=1871066 RepID=UPI000FE6830C|nr:hypothetical protein [Mesorhizobium sp.]RWO88574.1 MAG: hypothetical protein EOQ95_18400 [Mesorhizobium sp.]